MAIRPRIKKTTKRPSLKSRLSAALPDRTRAKTPKLRRVLAAKPEMDEDSTLRLNKFISRSGTCSRRDADILIKEGKVKVNGVVVTEMGHQVNPDDKVLVNGTVVRPENFIYVLLNKPTNTITTTEDEKGRQTVMDIVESNTGHRLYPVGRLDRDTTGVLLMSNDGDLANRLMHPSYSIGKVYEATCNRILSDEELQQLRTGIELEDGSAKAYRVTRHQAQPNIIIIAVHEGRNHLIKRMIAFFGAEVMKLKRTQYAGLSIEKLRPGRWRFLKAFEVNKLRASVKLPELRFTKQ